jgi:hypothetical protein
MRVIALINGHTVCLPRIPDEMLSPTRVERMGMSKEIGNKPNG